MSKAANKKLDSQRKESELSEAILQYLAEQPHGQDTPEGIATFWIMRQQIKVELKAVSNVLRQLTKSGRLEKVRLGKYTLYRLKRK